MKSDNSQGDSYSSSFRRRRMEQLAALLKKNELAGISILDIGGTKNFWEMNLKYLPEGLVKEVDIVNLPPQKNDQLEINGVVLRFYEGNILVNPNFRKKKYDLVHSNSVIEHVGNLSSQKKMAESVFVMGNYYWIQTPAKSFPLEPHFYVPFFPYIPLGLRATILRRFDLGFHKKESDWLQSRIVCEDTRLITRKEYACLFPKAKILNEKILCFTKSYTATNLT